MPQNKQKLELTWIGKENRPRLEPRILLEDPEKSYHAAHRMTEHDLFGNRLIFGDNLLALKALEQEFTGKIKCIFIDPPYNTGSAFEHYDDGIEHSLWLSLMRDRLDVLRNLLSQDGSLWITIGDNEAHYLKVLCDEIFGRNHFVANVVWQKKYAVANDHKTIAPMHDHILVYRKSEAWQRNLLERTVEKDRQYRFEDEKGIFRLSDYTCSKTAEERPNLFFPILQPTTKQEIWPSDTVYWQQGHSTERDFIYVTTANLSHDQLLQLSDEVGGERSLLVVCSAFRGRKEGYANLTVKKIPKAVLSRCEWGKDDYSLKVENLPKAPPKPGQRSLFGEEAES